MAGVDMLGVRLKLKSAATPAYFKHDGLRFLNSECTVKLAVDGEYELICQFDADDLTLEAPGVGLLRTFTDSTGEPERLEFVVKDDEAGRKRGNKLTCLQATWTNSLPITKDEERVYLFLDLPIVDFGKITLPLLVKTYHPDNPHIKNGFPLQHIQYRFRRDKETKGRTQLVGTLHCPH